MILRHVGIYCRNCNRPDFHPFRFDVWGEGMSGVMLNIPATFRVTCKHCGHIIRGESRADNAQNLMALYEITSELPPPPPPV